LTAAALLVLTGGVLWWMHHRTVLREDVTATLAEAIHLREAGQFSESHELLEQALARLGASGPSDLVDKAGTALADTRLVERLDTARQRLFDQAEADSPLDFADTEKEYATALSDAVLIRDGEDKNIIAARVRNSAVRTALLAAIQDWAAMTGDEGRRGWLLAIGCAVDPDPDRDRLRRPELWRDPGAMNGLADQPVPKSVSPELAVALARRAIMLNVREPVPLLMEVQKLHPHDFWLNFMTGWHLNHQKKEAEAVKYHRAALDIRPRAAAVYYNLGMAFRGQRKWDEAIQQFQEALRIDPTLANAHNGWGSALFDQHKPDEAMEHYKEALRLNPKHATAQVSIGGIHADRHELEAAIRDYEAALRINPRHAGAHYLYGNALRAKNEPDKAIGQYQEAINISPRYAAAHNALGKLLHDRKQYDPAIHHFEQAIQIEEHNASYHSNLGNSLRLRGRPDDAIKQFERALQIDTKNAFAHDGLGSTLSDKGDLDGAIAHHEKAIGLDYKNAGFHANLGNTLLALGRRDVSISQHKEALQKWDQAIEAFAEALKLDPKVANAHNGMGLALHAKGKPDEAMEHYKEALKIDPGHASALVNIGVILQEKGQIDEAIRNYDAALRINARHAGAHYHYGNALFAKKELDRAIGQYQEAVNISPRYAAAHNALGNALHAKNQFDQAIPHYEQAIQIEPTNASYRSNLGNSLRLKGRLDEAITRYQEGVRIDENHAPSHSGLGLALSDKGDLDGAIPHFEKAIERNPKNAGYHLNLGNTLHSLGRQEAAIREYRKALEIDAKNSMAHNVLGNAFLALGRLDEANAGYQQALQLDPKNTSALSNLGIAHMYGKGQVAEALAHFSDALRINDRNEVTHFNFGQALMALSRFPEARDAVRRAVQLLGPNQRYRELFQQILRQLEEADRLPALEARLPAILEGKEKPANAAEALKFAWLCQVKLRFAAAARLYADSFAEDPKPANELSTGYRLHAARSAALAVAGWGQDSPQPGDAERTRLRGQTLEWLRADLAAWQKQLALANQETRSAARRTLTLWLSDFRFFAVREKEELAKLPDKERAAWEKLWADTEALRIEARVDRAAERWADPGLRVVKGLELWLDASRLNAARQAGGQAPLKAGDEVETWYDNSGKGRHVSQAVQAARPQLVRVGQDWLVRFDGADDHLRCTGQDRSLDACTVFVVAAPQANPGGHLAFLAANEAGRRDYETGFTIDLGPGQTGRFDFLNFEGPGFGGCPNMLNTPSPFRTLHVLEAVASPEQKVVRLFLDGKPSGERPFAPALLRLAEITVGARYYTNGPGPQQVRGFLQGDIAEVLIYNRTLSADQTKTVQQYLDRKYARLREALPPR
jgi:tetratricopeptide (TPR) repeat protein